MQIKIDNQTQYTIKSRDFKRKFDKVKQTKFSIYIFAVILLSIILFSFSEEVFFTALIFIIIYIFIHFEKGILVVATQVTNRFTFETFEISIMPESDIKKSKTC